MKPFTLKFALGLLVFTACSSRPSQVSVGPSSKNPKPGVLDGLEGDGNLDPGVKVPVSSAFTGVECSAQPNAGLRSWRRLSNVEFKNTVTSVFGVTGVDYSGLVIDTTHQDPYDTMMVPTNYVDEKKLLAYRTVAKEIATKADLTKLFPCLSNGASCISSELKTLGALAWRRPLETSEIQSLTAIYSATSSDLGADLAARYVIQALILSQPFLYRSELGVKDLDGYYTLTDWEMASAISYTVLRSPPDATLRQLASSGGLKTKDAIKKQVTRLFADASSKTAWKDFGNMWLESNVIKDAQRLDPKVLPEALRTAAQAEPGNMFSEAFNANSSAFDAYLNANSVQTSADAQAIYGAAPVNGKLTFADSDRKGPLGLSAFLAGHSADDHTSPAKRGAFVLSRFLCSDFAPAPTIALPKRTGTQTNRDIYIGMEKGSCGQCHKPMNQVGFIFENFDMNGKWRTEVDGESIEIAQTPNIDGEEVKVHSISDFTKALAASQQGRECYSRQLFRYTFGRSELSPKPVIGATEGATMVVSSQAAIDNCQLRAAVDAMNSAGGDMKAPLVEFLSSDLFRKRMNKVGMMK